jgi:hypothetical protein
MPDVKSLWGRALLWGAAFSAALLALSAGSRSEPGSLLQAVQKPGTSIADAIAHRGALPGAQSAGSEVAAIVVTWLVNAVVYTLVAAAVLAWQRSRGRTR